MRGEMFIRQNQTSHKHVGVDDIASHDQEELVKLNIIDMN